MATVSKRDLFDDSDRDWPGSRGRRGTMMLLVSDLGGLEACSEAELAIIRRSSVLITEMERMERRFALVGAEGPHVDELSHYSRLANTLRRLLDVTGLERRTRNIAPSIDEYLDEVAEEDAA